MFPPCSRGCEPTTCRGGGHSPVSSAILVSYRLATLLAVLWSPRPTWWTGSCGLWMCWLRPLASSPLLRSCSPPSPSSSGFLLMVAIHRRVVVNSAYVLALSQRTEAIEEIISAFARVWRRAARRDCREPRPLRGRCHPARHRGAGGPAMASAGRPAKQALSALASDDDQHTSTVVDSLLAVAVAGDPQMTGLANRCAASLSRRTCPRCHRRGDRGRGAPGDPLLAQYRLSRSCTFDAG